jgi:hypothetical protein
MSPLVFPSLPELFFGLYLLYFFRVFERQVGSTKYMVCLFAVMLSPRLVMLFRIGYGTGYVMLKRLTIPGMAM